MKLKCDAVFEGGGVRGAALIGATKAIEDAGYEFVNMAGTSAGSIVASLLAVGYTGKELHDILLESDFSYLKFRDEGFLDKINVVGKMLGVVLEYGIYEGNYIQKWIEKLFLAKGKTTFGDIKTDTSAGEKPNYRFQAIASDLTDHRMLVLPEDIRDFGYDPDQLSLSLAVRMSTSIPLFFEPVKLTDSKGRIHFIVDGGLLSNYPVWLLDCKGEPRWPTFGFKLVDQPVTAVDGIPNDNSITSILEYFEALVNTMLFAHDKYNISCLKGDLERSIQIPATVIMNGNKKIINAIDFQITKEESKSLFLNGYQTARNFLSTWNFNSWKMKYRA